MLQRSKTCALSIYGTFCTRQLTYLESHSSSWDDTSTRASEAARTALSACDTHSAALVLLAASWSLPWGRGTESEVLGWLIAMDDQPGACISIEVSLVCRLALLLGQVTAASCCKLVADNQVCMPWACKGFNSSRKLWLRPSCTVL